MNIKNITLEQLAEVLGCRVRSTGNYKYIRVEYRGYFWTGTYHNIIVYRKKDKFAVYVHVNIPKASTYEMVVEQNGVKIVIEQMIEDAVNKIIQTNKT
jgi:hypothetical protein